MKNLKFATILSLLLGMIGFTTIHAQTPLTTVQIGTGYDRPLFLTHAPGDTTRLFIVEQDGAIKIIKNGVQLATPFIDLDPIVLSSGNEQGLLGLAFHPDYANNGFFYVNYTRNGDGATIVAKYAVSVNPDIASTTALDTLLIVEQPFSNHNGGMMAFHPFDGYLYVGFGDGGDSNDPFNLSQNVDSLLGKLIRIDVDTTDGYRIPPSNPFFGGSSPRPEIWATGLRNPWRWSFDRFNGVLWIADVGQNAIEEINFEPDTAAGGRNYGWRLKEGTSCNIPSSNCDPGNVTTNPISQYTHASGRCSITGGYIYRGCAIPDLQGAYFYGDFCTGEIFSIRYNGSTVSDSVNRDATLGVPNFSLVSFGEDAVGELYIVRRDGNIRKIVPNGVAAQPCGPCCIGTVGNVDGSLDQGVDIGDLTVLVDHLFISFMPLLCEEEGNVDGATGVDIGDLTVLVDHLFISFTPLGNCP